jgi:hypothetical protein
LFLATDFTDSTDFIDCFLPQISLIPLILVVIPAKLVLSAAKGEVEGAGIHILFCHKGTKILRFRYIFFQLLISLCLCVFVAIFFCEISVEINKKRGKSEDLPLTQQIVVGSLALSCYLRLRRINNIPPRPSRVMVAGSGTTVMSAVASCVPPDPPFVRSTVHVPAAFPTNCTVDQAPASGTGPPPCNDV